MNRTLLRSHVSVSLLVLLCIGMSAAQAQTRRVRWNAAPEEWQWVVPEKASGVEHHTLHSKAMNRKVGYNTFLPGEDD